MFKFNEEIENTFNQLCEISTQACGCGLTSREIAIAQLAASLAFNNDALISESVVRAKQQKVTNSDIGKLAAVILERQGKAFQALLDPIEQEASVSSEQNDGCCS